MLYPSVGAMDVIACRHARRCVVKDPGSIPGEVSVCSRILCQLVSDDR